MITNKFKVEKKEKMDYPPIPKDVYPVELLDITEKERPTYKTKFMPKDQQVMESVLVFQFTILQGKDNETDLRGRNFWANFVPTYLYEGKNGKNELWQIAEAILGRSLTPEDEATLDSDVMNAWIGKQIRITNDHRAGKTGGVFDTISGYLKQNGQSIPLTSEEKEKAKVKPKEKEKESEDTHESTMSLEEQNEILNTIEVE